MSPIPSHLPGLTADQLLANVILLHESTRDDQLLSEVPGLLATTVGADSAAMVLLTFSHNGVEISRTSYPPPADPSVAIDPNIDWVTQLLRARTLDQIHSPAPFARFLPSGEAHVLFMIGRTHAVAFSIRAPGLVRSHDPAVNDWLVAVLTHVTRNVRERVFRPGPATLRVAPLSTLTKAEWRVLLALDSDHGEKQIAAFLAISPHTLHSHVKNIYRKFQVQSRLSAIFCLRRAERLAMMRELAPRTRPVETSSPFETGGSASPMGTSEDLDPPMAVSPVVFGTPRFPGLGRVVLS
jgi:DNA-binding CsgD family transcriptional regulator